MNDEFFIGYVPTPQGLRRKLLTVVALLATGVLAVAALLAGVQRSPGEGRWESGAVQTLQGVYLERPYPMLRVAQAHGGVRTVLLVGVGKVAATAPKQDWAGRHVRASGTTLRRGDLWLFEVVGALEPLDDASGESSSLEAPAADMTMHGEVLDPKCFAGAMKPGDGKTHKGCAALCLRGGVPPVFRHAASGQLYLLVEPRLLPCRGEVLQSLIDVVGEPVVVRGRVSRAGDLPMLEVGAGAVRRR